MVKMRDRRVRRRLGLSRRARRRLIDVGLVLLSVVFVTTGAAFIDANYRSALPPIVLGIWLGAPIAFTRHRPLLTWATLLMAMAVYPFAVSSVMLQDVPGVIDQEIAPLSWPPTVLIGYSLVQYSVAVGHRRLVAVATWLCALGVGTLSVHLKELGAGTPDIPLLVTLGLVALVAGDNVRGRRETRARLQAEEQRSEVLRTKRALLEERARIARELHDIVAHHMSVIAVQASTAAYRVPGLRPEAETEFDSIADTARASMTELRRLLAVLRSEDEEGALSPQPGLGDIDELVRSTRSAGTEVALKRVDVPERTSDAVSLTAYRILQEALSNVIRHAPRATARVELRGESDALVLDIVNDIANDIANDMANDMANDVPDGSPEVLTSGARHGILGMRERAELVGGQLRAAGPEGGGFRVTAVLPLHASASSSARAGEPEPGGPGGTADR